MERVMCDVPLLCHTHQEHSNASSSCTGVYRKHLCRTALLQQQQPEQVAPVVRYEKAPQTDASGTHDNVQISDFPFPDSVCQRRVNANQATKQAPYRM